jgi:hypothetical protein
MFDRIIYRSFDPLGYLLCDLAFKTDCRGPFAWAYRAGCWFYGKADDAGIRCGELIANPAYRLGADEPHYVLRQR